MNATLFPSVQNNELFFKAILFISALEAGHTCGFTDRLYVPQQVEHHYGGLHKILITQTTIICGCTT